MRALWSLLFLSVCAFAAEPVWKKSVKVTSGKYSNLDVSVLNQGKWQGFDTLELEVTNATSQAQVFYLTLSDESSSDYWTKLNFKTTVTPGKNTLSFPLAQWVGESGSHRFQRGLNLNKLRGWFVYIEGNNVELLIHEFRLSKQSAVAKPAGLVLFDFTTSQLPEARGHTKVTENESFRSEVGHGFVEKPRFWRSEDAFHAPLSLRGTITALEATFRVNLPNGEYEAELVWDRLGYWDPSFWRKRSLAINGKMTILETRSASDYLADLFRFSALGETTSNPYQSLLFMVFPAKHVSFSVTSGHADFSFSGNETGVALNQLIIWPKQKNSEAKSFLSVLRASEVKEWEKITRDITPHLTPLNVAIGAVELQAKLTSVGFKNPRAEITLKGARGAQLGQLLQVAPGEINWSFSPLTHSSGEQRKLNFQVSSVSSMYSSADINHETFERVKKLLRPLRDRTQFSTGEAHYLWVDLFVETDLPVGTWKGDLTIETNGKKQVLPLTLVVQSYALPAVEIAVGFFGLTNLPPNYFGGDALDKFRLKVAQSSLELLHRHGFTAFSGLPDPRSGEFKRLLHLARTNNMQVAYSYGGEFGSVLKSLSATEAVEMNEFFTNQRAPEIVHTFSDEADGYQNRLDEDRVIQKQLKEKYPQLKLAAFGSMDNSSADDFYRGLDVGLYTKVDDWKLGLWSKKGHRWGAYNAAVGNFSDPRFSFGVGLYLASARGLTQYLEWQAVNNYPYLEMDGRETDVAAWLPEQGGDVMPTIRFKLAAEGLLTYRKLKALETKAKTDGKAKAWLEKLAARFPVFQASRLLTTTNYQHASFVRELDQLLD